MCHQFCKKKNILFQVEPLSYEDLLGNTFKRIRQLTNNNSLSIVVVYFELEIFAKVMLTLTAHNWQK